MIIHGTTRDRPPTFPSEAGDVQAAALYILSPAMDMELPAWVLGWSTVGAGRIALRCIGTTQVAGVPLLSYALLQPPGGVVLPSQLAPNQPFVQQITTTALDGSNPSRTTFTVVVRELSVRVVAPAGDFEDCIQLDISLETAAQGVVLSLWLARGVGVVKWHVETLGYSETAVLEWASVRGTTYGRRQTITTAGDIPCSTGVVHIWQDDNGHKKGQRVGGPIPKGGLSCYPVWPFTVNLLNADPVYWLASDNAFVALWGWPGPADDYILRPSGFRWPDQLTLGVPVVQQGDVEYAGDPTHGRWTGLIELVATDVTVGDIAGCYVVAWRLEADDTAGPPLVNARISRFVYLFIKPGVGPVRAVTAYPGYTAVEADLVYFQGGQQVYGVIPQLDYVNAMRLQPGERRVLDDRIETAITSRVFGGQRLLEVINTRTWWRSTFWDISATPVRLMGFADPPSLGTLDPVAIVPPMQIPHPLAMGNSYVHQAELRKLSTNEPVGTITIYLMFVATEDASVPDWPDASNAAKVEALYVIRDTANQVTRYFVEQWFATAEGKVKETIHTRRPDGFRFTERDTLVAAKGPSGDFGWNFRVTAPADYMPFASGNEWMFGDPTNKYVLLTSLDQRDDPDMGPTVPLLRRRYLAAGPSETFYFRAPLTSLSIVGCQPRWYYRAGKFETPLTFPDRWEVGDVVRTRCNWMVDVAGQDTPVPAEILIIPCDTPSSLSTPAGTFTNLVKVKRIMAFDFTTIGRSFEWLYATIYYADGVGPVTISEYGSSLTQQYVPGSLVYASVNGRTYGTRP